MGGRGESECSPWRVLDARGGERIYGMSCDVFLVLWIEYCFGRSQLFGSCSPDKDYSLVIHVLQQVLR